jgi:hypothetical protein
MNKKLLVVMTLLLLAVPLRAQWYVGGSLAFRSSEGGQSTSMVLRPEVGYSWENWSFGVAFAFDVYKMKDSTQNDLSLDVSPYVDYYFWRSGILSFYVEGGCGFRRSIAQYNTYTSWTPFLKPCLEISLADHWAVQGSLGRLEYDTHFKNFSFELDNGISVGLYYSF